MTRRKSQILVINPRRKNKTTKKRRTNKKRVASKKRTKKPARRKLTARRKTGGLMAKKRKRSTRKPVARRNPSRRRSPARKNPSRKRAAARRASSAFRNILTTKNVIDAAKQTGGMLAAQFCAKKFASGGGANDADWTWQNYAMAGVGAVGSGLVADMIKPGSGKEFFKGGLGLIMYKLVTNELAQRSEFINNQFGANEDIEVFLGQDGQYYSPGDQYLGDDGEVYLMGPGGKWVQQYSNAGYLTPESDLGDTLVPPGPLGSELAPPSELGDAYSEVLSDSDPYLKALS